MKKRNLLILAIAGITYVTLSSDMEGVGHQAGYDCTGAETGLGNAAGCASGPSGCHSTAATAGINVALVIDSSGTPVTHYVAGHTYTVKLSGVNTTASTLPKFGFQVAAIKGSAAVGTPVNAGTLQSTGLPAHVRYTPTISGSFVTNIVEQSAPIPAASGTGGTGTTYVDSFTWTAPVAGTGTVSFWAALNAVDNNTTNDPGDLWNTTNTSLTELTIVSTGVNTIVSTGVNNVANNIALSIYPNPVANSMNIKFEDAAPGNYSVQVFDLNGRIIATENITGTAVINTSSWVAGMYYVSISGNGAQKVVPVVKQ